MFLRGSDHIQSVSFARDLRGHLILPFLLDCEEMVFSLLAIQLPADAHARGSSSCNKRLGPCQAHVRPGLIWALDCCEHVEIEPKDGRSLSHFLSPSLSLLLPLYLFLK